MSLALVLSIAALAGALALIRTKPVVLPVVAVIAAALEIGVAVKVIRVTVAHVPLPLLFGGALAVTGIVMLLRNEHKWSVVAATVVAVVGVIQTLQALKVLVA
jgi:hypothetical protein